MKKIYSLFFMVAVWSMSNAMEQQNGDQGEHISHYTLAQLRNGTQAVQRQQQLLLQPQQQNYALNPAYLAVFGLQEEYTLRNLLERYDSVRWRYAMPDEAYKISKAFEALYPYARQRDDQQNYEPSIEGVDLHQQPVNTHQNFFDRNEEHVQQLPEISYNGHDNNQQNYEADISRMDLHQPVTEEDIRRWVEYDLGYPLDTWVVLPDDTFEQEQTLTTVVNPPDEEDPCVIKQRLSHLKLTTQCEVISRLIKGPFSGQYVLNTTKRRITTTVNNNYRVYLNRDNDDDDAQDPEPMQE